MSSDTLGLVGILALVAGLVVLTLISRLPRSVKWLVCLALGLRVLGAVARHEILFGFYEGIGDATGYYGRGLWYADMVRELDFAFLFDRSYWYAPDWWGTQFVFFPSAAVLTVVGPSMLGGFVAFSLLAFAGLAAIAVTFHARYPDGDARWFLLLLFLFPSLWYWPSSIGKDAIALLGLGLAVYGFARHRNAVAWLPLGTGLFLLFGVRPGLAGLLGICLLAAQWLSYRGPWSVGRVTRSAVLLSSAALIVWWAAESVGIPGLSPEGVQEWVEMNPARSIEDGTLVPAADVSLAGIPLAITNVLARPFPWEATNPFVLLSSLELILLWGLVWIRRRNLLGSLKRLRDDRLLALSLLFVVGYSLALGLTVVNSGVIARQRTLMLPLLFVLLSAHGLGGRGGSKGAPVASVVEARR